MKSRLHYLAMTGVCAVTLMTFPTSSSSQSTPGDQTDVRISQMNIDIWPEYDDPRVLVIYSGELEADVEVPRDFALIIPRGAQIHMAGALGERGEHLHALFEARPRGETLTEVSYRIETRKFYMEFYYDPFTGSDPKEFRYPLVAVHPIDRLVVKVQQPLKASEFRTTPIAVDVLRDAEGFNYHRIMFDEVTANDERSISVSYVKSDRNPSVAKAGVSTTPGGSSMKTILIVGAVLLVGAVGLGTLASSMRGKTVAVRAGAGASQAVQGAATERHRQHKYCRTCGVSLNSGDMFCGECGAKA